MIIRKFKKAVREYVDHYNPKKTNIETISNNFSKTKIFYLALENNKLIGVIRGNKNRITNLFVRKGHHKKGIGKKLVQRFEKTCYKLGSQEIKIKASLYAAHFYQKLGYKKTTGIRNFKGLRIQPMKKILE